MAVLKVIGRAEFDSFIQTKELKWQYVKTNCFNF
jgi:hypothetical protein